MERLSMIGKQVIDVAPHVPRMRRVALRMLGNVDEADDAVQDACFKAVRAGVTFEGRAHLATWLHQIVTRCALDRIRDRRRQASMSADGEGTLSGVIAYAADGPFERAQRSELRAIVIAAVEELPDDCRQAFVLTQFDGYSYDEASRIEGLPRGTIASRVFRARQILTDRLGDQLGGGMSHE